jgi:hypothetical protein
MDDYVIGLISLYSGTIAIVLYFAYVLYKNYFKNRPITFRALRKRAK